MLQKPTKERYSLNRSNISNTFNSSFSCTPSATPTWRERFKTYEQEEAAHQERDLRHRSICLSAGTQAVRGRQRPAGATRASRQTHTKPATRTKMKANAVGRAIQPPYLEQVAPCRPTLTLETRPTRLVRPHSRPARRHRPSILPSIAALRIRSCSTAPTLPSLNSLTGWRTRSLSRSKVRACVCDAVFQEHISKGHLTGLIGARSFVISFNVIHYSAFLLYVSFALSSAENGSSN